MKRKHIVLDILETASFCVLMVSLSLLLFKTSSALTMSNSNFNLYMGNLNSGAGRGENASYKLGVTIGQTAPGLYSGTNYKVRAGFQYIHSIIPFSFSISQLTIDFGNLSATNPVTRSNRLRISNGSAHGYSVTAYENHQLNVPSSGAILPDTTCDDGSCTQSTSAAWTSSLTYGFGYRCDNVVGTDCATGFSDATYYKHFADNSASETPIAVMTGLNVGRNKQVDITYKVNISGTQAAGLYSNQIIYIATATF